MPINPEMVNALINDALTELSEINKRKVKLEELVAYLRKYLKEAVSAVCPGEIYDERPMKVVGMDEIRVVRFRRKESHATKIETIVHDSTVKLKVRDIVNKYPKYGWRFKNPKNAYNQLFRTVKARPDLFIYEDGYVLLKNQEQAPSKEVMT